MTIIDCQNDGAVQATNNSSFMSKISMIQQGYAKNEDISLYLPMLRGKKPVRRAPLINRYVARLQLHFVGNVLEAITYDIWLSTIL